MSFLSKVLNIGGGEVGDLVDSVGKVADSLFTSEEEIKEQSLLAQKASYEYALEKSKIELQETGLYLEDINSARDANVKIQESDDSSWLAKNTLYLLAFLLIFFTFGLMGMMIWGPDVTGVKHDIIVMVLGILSSISVQVVSFFFGSSAGSKEKTTVLNSAIKK